MNDPRDGRVEHLVRLESLHTQGNDVADDRFPVVKDMGLDDRAVLALLDFFGGKRDSGPLRLCGCDVCIGEVMAVIGGFEIGSNGTKAVPRHPGTLTSRKRLRHKEG